MQCDGLPTGVEMEVVEDVGGSFVGLTTDSPRDEVSWVNKGLEIECTAMMNGFIGLVVAMCNGSEGTVP